ncbi:MAG: helix-turn-helix domain-containing protein [Peptococcaceae bacterium]|jgi:lichenan operon transcriptional antiterminator|nr:helix-turn-helix domain-containing protein [Peptococcaceae bacterium]
MHVLKKKSEVIINKLILSDGELSSRDIQEDCFISRKTLTVEMPELNKYLKSNGARIETVKGKGYAVRVLDSEKYQVFRAKFLYHFQRGRYLHFDDNLLAYLILFEFALHDRYIHINELAEKYFYSHGTVAGSVKFLKVFLAKYNCDLESRPNHGLRLKGGEWKRRICLLLSLEIAHRVKILMPEARAMFDPYFDEERYDYPILEQTTGNILRERQVHVPLINLSFILNYILLSQSRLEYRDSFSFPEEQVSRILRTRYHAIGQALADALEPHGFVLKGNDIIAVSIMLNCYASRQNVSELEPAQYAAFHQTAAGFLLRIRNLHPGSECYLDDAFVKEFTCYLAEVQERQFFGISANEESVYIIKQDGYFITELCYDFAVYYDETRGIRLSEAELLNAYYIISSSRARNYYQKSTYKAVFVSQYGIHFARNLAERCLRIHREVISDIVPMEFVEINGADLSGYDFLITDISPERYSYHTIPIIRLDFYRDPNSRSLIQHLSMLLANELRNIVRNQNLVRKQNFKNKKEVFSYLAEHYIRKDERRDFLDDCLNKDAFISYERCNRIALAPASSRFHAEEPLVLLFNKKPFLWDNERVQMILFYSRRSQPYFKSKALTSLILSLLHGNAHVAQSAGQMDAEDLISFAVKHTFGYTAP